jgi:hypothetical protein
MSDIVQDSPAIQALQRIPFVREVRLRMPGKGAQHFGLEVSLRTSAKAFTLYAEDKRSFLTRGTVTEFQAWARQYPLLLKKRQILLLGRHIPRPIGESLVEAGINFADDAGNVHLTLDNNYSWTVMGRPALEPASEKRPISPAQLQLLFQFATDPDSAAWTVRKLAAAAGISKSKVAQARKQMLADGLLKHKGKHYRIPQVNLLADRLAAGYSQILRPKLVIGRFRPAEKKPAEFLARMRASNLPNLRFALTGGPAASLLQDYYSGPEIPLYVRSNSHRIAQELKLLPDRSGPVTLLRAFGDVVFWEERQQHMLAPPWLIYAELLATDDPRAHEAAQEIRREFLSRAE